MRRTIIALAALAALLVPTAALAAPSPEQEAVATVQESIGIDWTGLVGVVNFGSQPPGTVTQGAGTVTVSSNTAWNLQVTSPNGPKMKPYANSGATAVSGGVPLANALEVTGNGTYAPLSATAQVVPGATGSGSGSATLTMRQAFVAGDAVLASGQDYRLKGVVYDVVPQ